LEAALVTRFWHSAADQRTGESAAGERPLPRAWRISTWAGIRPGPTIPASEAWPIIVARSRRGAGAAHPLRRGLRAHHHPAQRLASPQVPPSRRLCRRPCLGAPPPAPRCSPRPPANSGHASTGTPAAAASVTAGKPLSAAAAIAALDTQRRAVGAAQVGPPALLRTRDGIAYRRRQDQAQGVISLWVHTRRVSEEIKGQ